MKKEKKLMFILLIILLSSLFFSSVVCAEKFYTFNDSFSDYEERMYSGYGTVMQENWRTANENEIDESFSSLPMGFDGEKLKISTNTDTVGQKYTTMRAKQFPTAVLSVDNSKISKSQKIVVKAKKSHGSDMWGVRFYVHNDADGKLNYYTLFFGGMHTRGYDTSVNAESGGLIWGLYKCEGDTVTTLREKVRVDGYGENSFDGYMGIGDASLEISVDGGNINWKLDYVLGDVNYTYSDTYKDLNGFDISEKSTTVHLYAAGSNNNTRYVYFDDFNLESNWISPDYIDFDNNEEAIIQRDAVFINAAKGYIPNDDGVIDLKDPQKISGIYCPTGRIPEIVLVSKDNTVWYKLCKKDDFNDGVFLNSVNGDNYRYLYAGNYIEEICFLVERDLLEFSYIDEDIILYPRINDINYFSGEKNILVSNNENIAFVQGNKVFPKKPGNITISTTDKTINFKLQMDFICPLDEMGVKLYGDALPSLQPVDGIYTLKEKESIRKFIVSDIEQSIIVYASNDKTNWEEIYKFTYDREYYNEKYLDEYSFIKIVGTGTVNVLSIIEGKSFRLIPGQGMEVFVYRNGVRLNEVNYEVENAYVDITDNIITPLSNIKETEIGINVDNEKKKFSIYSSKVPLVFDFVPDGKNMNLTLYSNGIDIRKCFLQIVKYNSDHSLNDISFEEILFEDGKRIIVVDDVFTFGTYTAIRIVNENFIPLTNIKILN